jgi:hypothetical protein
MSKQLREAGFSNSKLVEDLFLPKAWAKIPELIHVGELKEFPDEYFPNLFQVSDASFKKIWFCIPQKTTGLFFYMYMI